MADRVENFNVRKLRLEAAKLFRERATKFLFGDGESQKGDASGDYIRLATIYPVGEMRPFVGPAVVHDLMGAKYDYPLVEHEHTVGVKRGVMERGDGISSQEFTKAVAAIANSPFARLEKDLTQLLVDNGTDITGASFFNDNSTPGTKVIPGTTIEVTNDGSIAAGAAITAASIRTAAWAARTMLMTMRNSMNARYHEVDQSYSIMYGPGIEEAVQNAFGFGVTINDQSDLKRLFVPKANPYLPNAAATVDQYIYVFLRGDPYGALGWGETKAPTFGATFGKSDAEGVIEENRWKAQSYWDFGVGYGSPFSVVRIELDVT